MKERLPWLLCTSITPAAPTFFKPGYQACLDWILLSADLFQSKEGLLHIYPHDAGLAGSDHAMITQMLKIPSGDNPANKVQKAERFRKTTLDDLRVMRTAISEAIADWLRSCGLSTNSAWLSFITLIREALPAFHPFEPSPARRPWISAEAKRRIDIRRAAKSLATWTPRTTSRVQTEMRRNKRIWMERKAEQLRARALTAASLFCGSPMQAWKAIKLMRQSLQPTPSHSIKTDEIALNWQAKWNFAPASQPTISMLAATSWLSNFEQSPPQQSEVNSSSIAPTFAEVEYAISRSKRNKSPGIDGLTTDILKEGGEHLVHALCHIFAIFWREEAFPMDMFHSTIIPLPKIAVPTSPSDFRPISLTSCVGKVFEHVLVQRINRLSEECRWIAPEQCGFQPGRRIEENLLVINQLVHQRNSHTLWAGFLDIRGAYDSVHRDLLWHKLHCLGMPDKLIRVLRATYAFPMANVRSAGVTSAPFTTGMGLRQGSVSSPILYNLFVNEIVTLLKGTTEGVQLGDSTIQILLYADDMTLLADSEEDLQLLFDKVVEISVEWGFSFNAAKSAVVPFGSEARSKMEWKLGTEFIKELNQYNYLGIVLHSSAKWTTQAAKLHGITLGSMESLAAIGLLTPFTPIKSIRMLVSSFIRPTLFYGSAILPLHARGHLLAKQRVDRAWLKILKSALGLESWECGIAASETLTQMSSTAIRALAFFSFYRHLALLPEHNLAKKAMIAAIEGPKMSQRNPWAITLLFLAKHFEVDLAKVCNPDFLNEARRSVSARDRADWWQQAVTLKRLVTMTSSIALLKTICSIDLAHNANARNIVVRLRTGANSLFVHLKQRKIRLCDECVLCDQHLQESARHILLECGMFEGIRHRASSRLAKSNLQHLWSLPQDSLVARMLLYGDISRDEAVIWSTMVEEIWSERNKLLGSVFSWFTVIP
jgi:hypothetical protein